MESSTDHRPRLFEEITSNQPEPIDLLPDEVEAYISKIEPKTCAKLIKELGFLLPLIKFDDKICSIDDATGNKIYPWPVLGHLRRVRRVKKEIVQVKPVQEESQLHDDDGDSEPPKKRKKVKNNNQPNDVQLEILLGSVHHIDFILGNDNEQTNTTRTKLNELITINNLNLEKRKLPGRPAKSQTERDEWASRDDGEGWWPSLYFEKQSIEYREKELELDINEEWGLMKNSLMDAFDDAKKYTSKIEGDLGGLSEFGGAVVVCAESKKVVSRSYDEWRSKVEEGDGGEERVKELLSGNPLNTPVMLAIQGVSRIERLAAIGKGIDSDSFKNGQYLCTG